MATEVTMTREVMEKGQDCLVREKPQPKNTLRHCLRILWLFTESDFATFVIPDTAFGFFGSLAGPLMSNSPQGLNHCLRRLPFILASNWLNLLIFDLANQRTDEAMAEDAINKPWRPLPAGLTTPKQARRMLLAALPGVFAINYTLGVWKESLMLFTLTWMYNDLRGGDDHFVLRNLIIGLAFGYYNEGSLRVAIGRTASITTHGWGWIFIISLVIFTTMHIQDMKDQAGDKLRGRHSAPLILGDRAARWTIALPVAVWSFVCPAFWGLGLIGYLIPVTLGMYVSIRILKLRNVNSDRRTWQIWTAWTACLYFLPVVKDHNMLLSAFGTLLKSQ